MELNLVLACEVSFKDTLTVCANLGGGLTFISVEQQAVSSIVLSDANVAKLALALHKWQCRELD